MIARLALLLALTLPAASAQSSGAFAPARPTALEALASLDVQAAERTTVLLDALVLGARRPFAEAAAPNRTDRAAADFGRYLDTVTAGIGPVRAYRLVRIQAHARAATTVLVEVEGTRGADVLRFVWRDGALVLLNRGPRVG